MTSLYPVCNYDTIGLLEDAFLLAQNYIL